jgi:exopolysaccharide production protein ExoZ
MEGLRGLAVFLVFTQHYAYQVLTLGQFAGIELPIIAAMRSYGNIGVELFFVLSGYLIYGTLVRRNPRFLDFMRRRIVRIYPAFLAVFLIYLMLHLIKTGDDKIPADPLSAGLYVAANLLLLPGLFPIVPLLSVTWSLSYEMFFYVSTAILVAALRMDLRARRQRLMVLATITIMFLASCFISDAVPSRMMPFFAGMLLAEGIGVSQWRVPSFLGLAAPVTALLLSRNVPMPWNMLELMHTVALFLLCASALAGGAAARVFSWSPARWLGNISYSYYLLHGLTIIPLAVVVGHLFGHSIPSWILWLAMPFVFVVSLGPALVLFIFIERPFSLTPGRRIPEAAQVQPAV